MERIEQVIQNERSITLGFGSEVMFVTGKSGIVFDVSNKELIHCHKFHTLEDGRNSIEFYGGGHLPESIAEVTGQWSHEQVIEALKLGIPQEYLENETYINHIAYMTEVTKGFAEQKPIIYIINRPFEVAYQKYLDTTK